MDLPIIKGKIEGTNIRRRLYVKLPQETAVQLFRAASLDGRSEELIIAEAVWEYLYKRGYIGLIR